MSVQTATLEMLEALNAIVTKTRELHEGIPETVVVLGASGATRQGQKHGHFAPRSWKLRGDEKNSELYGEIFLAGESLERGAGGTLGTLLHELAHAYCHANDIKDTSNNHRYHNQKFKEVAESFGLEIEKAQTIGWSVTSVPESTIKTYRKEIDALEAAIKTHRLGAFDLKALGLDPPKAKQKKRKMQCPECEDPILTTLKWFEANGHNLKCDSHDMYFEMYEEE